ncbi:MAG: M23 family metallopeptidase [Candidatus Gottesmanbacteria bacterium]|nr:M23 family metallopeptidase [Candidatus Gottesmanbacteria bacterium]
MDEFASPQETQRALGYLLKLQEDPETLEGFFNKYPGANPFGSWPFLKEPTEAFLRFFEKTGPLPEQGVEAAIPLPNSVDDLKLRELVEEFDKEFAAAKEMQVNASTASKKFVSALVENAKKSNVTIPETQAPVPTGAEGAPVSPERVQSIISAAVQYPGPPEEKMLVFHALTSFASEQPNKEVKELIPRAVEVTETARVLSSPDGTFPREPSFSVLATNNFQKGVAGVLDVVVPPAAKEAIINKILLQPLDTVVNHPEALSRDLMGTMVDRWGANFVNSSWFTQLRADANHMIGDQKSALKVTTRFTALVSDIATTVFRGPLTVNGITYVETYRLVATQGIQMVSVPHYGNVALGYGGQLVRAGANYAIRKGVKAGIRAGVEKAAVSGAVKVGAEAIAGAGTGVIGTLVMFGADLLRGLVNKGLSVFKNLVGMGTSKNPEDNLLLVVGAGVVLVFFLPLFPLLNLPAFNQSMIDTAIVTGVGGGIGEGPGINCQTTPDDPQCKFTPCTGDCRWPTSGYITQGPRAAQFCSPSANPTHGSGSASSQNAIDFSSMSGGAVYATRIGTIQRIYTGCPESGASIDPWCGGGQDPTNPGDGPHPEYAGYGNHVVLITDSGYTIIFGHLKSAIGVRYGQKITDPNTQIGWVDNSGHSFGTHLHWGVLSGENILDLVPTNDPALTPAAIDGCIQQTQGCTKVCPLIPVTAES